MADNLAGGTLASPLAALKRVSAELARDAFLIQGAGGKPSLKCDDVLWVKASGCWLEDAEETPIFVPVLAQGPSLPSLPILPSGSLKAWKSCHCRTARLQASLGWDAERYRMKLDQDRQAES